MPQKIDVKTLEQFVKKEMNFITSLFSVAAVPDRKVDDLDEVEDNIRPEEQQSVLKNGKFSRAKSLQELQERLEAITSKKKLSYKEKLQKKNLKNKMKKKSKQDDRHAKHKLLRIAKLNEEQENKSDDISHTKLNDTKPIFNPNDKMVFSKIDFANLGIKKKKKEEKDPKKLLKKIEEQQEKIKSLEKEGAIEKAVKIKEQSAWKSALAKAEGIKVKDDPILLKKTVKRKEQKQRSSKKKWEARITGVNKAKEEKQKKRTENIQKRKKEKKVKKLKQSAKKGKIIPGF